MPEFKEPTPVLPWLQDLSAYKKQKSQSPTDLCLASNEGETPSWFATFAAEWSGSSHRYPDASSLTQLLAERWSVTDSEVLVGAGVDDLIERICRATLAPGCNVVSLKPTFEMIAKYARACGAEMNSVSHYGKSYPIRELLERTNDQTRLLFVVSPNNPTGAVAQYDDVVRLATARPDCWIVVDLAYQEYSEQDDFTQDILGRPNIIVLRTFSKAWGLAGLRVGYALAQPSVIQSLRAAGAPYAVSQYSLDAAETACRIGESEMRTTATVVRSQVRELADRLRSMMRGEVLIGPNFVTCDTRDAEFLAKALAALGVLVRTFPEEPTLLRITCPGSRDKFERLLQALDIILSPQALLFDMDGVLADVSQSYDRSILETVKALGGSTNRAQIEQRRAEGNANNDWRLTHDLLTRQNVFVDYASVKETFEQIYQGVDQRGLWQLETPLIAPQTLQALARRFPLGIVTGRPRADAQRFLKQHKLTNLFPVVVCLEDGPTKPNPEPVRLALGQLGVKRAWMFGDTPDDMLAAQNAGVLPVALTNSKSLQPALSESGASVVRPANTESLNALMEVIPS